MKVTGLLEFGKVGFYSRLPHPEPLVYKTLLGASKAINYCRQIDPDKHYIIQTVDSERQQWLRQFEEVAS